MPLAAFDLHKREIEACVRDEEGRITHRQRFPTTTCAITVVLIARRPDEAGVNLAPVELLYMDRAVAF